MMMMMMMAWWFGLTVDDARVLCGDVGASGGYGCGEIIPGVAFREG